MDRATLARALDSAAAQTYPNIEIVVVSASSSIHAEVPSVWAGRPVRFVAATAARGRADAANVAIAAATGEWLNFLDDDDELLPDHVQALLDENTDIATARVVYSKSLVVDEAGTMTSFGKAHWPLDLLFRSQFCVHSAMFHRSLSQAGVRFDHTLMVHEDLDFWIQCAQQTSFRFVDRFTGRWHAFIGTSGAGGGANFNPTTTTSSLRHLQSKWIHLVPGWAELLPFSEVSERGQNALKAGHASLAVALMEHVLERTPSDINSLNLAGVAQLRAGNAGRAVELFTRAITIYPDHQHLVANLRLAQSAMAASECRPASRGR